MATTPEGKVKNRIKKMLDAYKPRVYYFMPTMGPFGKSGVPDIVASVGGVFFGIEVKHDRYKNPPTALQMKNLDEIKTTGAAALVVDEHNIDGLEALIKGVLADENDTPVGDY